MVENQRAYDACIVAAQADPVPHGLAAGVRMVVDALHLRVVPVPCRAHSFFRVVDIDEYEFARIFYDFASV